MKTDRVPANAGSLFNLREDPGETKTLSQAYPEKALDLKKMMDSYMETFKQDVRPREKVLESY